MSAVPTAAAPNLQWAQAYAAQGLVVLPLWPGKKVPHASRQHPERALLGGGFKLDTVGSTDPEQLIAWWAEEPNAGIGVVCGVRSRLLLVDIDTKNAGEFAWEAWKAEREEVLPPSPVVRTPSGGYHLWFLLPVGVDVRSWDGWLPGVDVLGSGHWAALPPTYVTDHGKAYEFLPDGAKTIPEAPGWFLEAVTKPSRRRTPGGTTEAASDFEGERFDWGPVFEGEPVPPGAQNALLHRAACSCRARRQPDDIALNMLRMLVRNFENGDPSDPWTDQHVVDMWERVKAEYPEGTGQDAQILPWRPRIIPGGGGDDIEDEPPAPTERGGGEEHPGRNTDRWNAQELARLFGDQLMWTPAQDWWCWDGTRWAHDTTHRVRRLVEQVIETLWLQAASQPATEEGEALAGQFRGRARRLEMVAGLKACLEYAQQLLAVPDEALDVNPHLLNCTNGTLDLLSGELRPHAQGDRLTRVTGTEYDPEARSDLLDEYLATFVPEPEHQEAMWRLLGACLPGGNDARVLLLLIGGTTSGKSQLASGLERALGDYVGIGTASIFRGNLDDKPRPDILKLLTARLALLEEAGQSWELHGDRIKHLTGGSTVTVRGMRSNAFITREPAFTPVVIANELPRVKGADAATLRRMKVIPFLHSVVGVEDPRKKIAFLADESTRMALLAQVVAGYGAYLERGVEELPEAFGLATMRAFEALDDVQEFIEWHVDLGVLRWDAQLSASGCVKSSDLHATYVRWITKHGDATQKRDRLGPKQFTQRLLAKGWEQRRSDGMRWAGWELRDPLNYVP